MERNVRCKRYHEAYSKLDEGYLREKDEKRKSRCPGWAIDPDLRRALIEEAIEDPDAGQDMWGHPKRLWSAVAGWFFVGISTNERQASYNCFPEYPATQLIDELARRSDRSIEQVLLLESRDGYD